MCQYITKEFHYDPKDSLKHKKKEAEKIARQLCYSKYVIEKIKNAKSETEINRILKAARLSR